jgi:ribosomal protein S4E
MKKTSPPSPPTQATVKDGDHCRVVGGTHRGKSGIVRDLNVSKTGHLTITVVQKNGDRFKALARNVQIEAE